MHKKKKLLLKIISVILLIILIFAAIILISYETQHGSQSLINNNNFSNYQAPILSDSNSIEIEQINQDIIIETDIVDELEITIIPENEVISGFMQITINNYPYGTEEILVMVSPEHSANPVEDEDTFINFIEASFNTEFVIDSKEFPNGEYLLTIATTHDSTPEDEPWTSIIKREITISN
jgi:hypothetical protein